MKKLVSLIIALALVLCLATAVSAATGSQADPYVIESMYGLYGIDAAAGDTYYQFTADVAGMILKIAADENLTFYMDGTALVPVDGEISATIAADGSVLKVTNSTDTEIETMAGLEPPVGSEYNPIQINNVYDLTGIDAAAGDTYYVFSPYLAGKTLTIVDAEGLTFTLNGTELVAVDGIITAEIVPAGPRGAQLKVTNSTDAEIETMAGLEDPLGSENNPIQINNAYDLTGIDAAAGDTYYVFSPYLAGKILTIVNAEGLTFTLNGTELVAVDGMIVAEIVPAGPRGAQLKVTNSTDAEIETMAGLEDPLGSENNPIQINNTYDLTGIDAAAGDTYYVFSPYLAGKILTIVNAEGLTFTLNGTELVAVDGMIVAEIVPAGPRGAQLKVTNSTDAEIETMAGLEDPLGSENNPIQISNVYDLTGIDAAAGDTYYVFSSMLAGKFLTIVNAEGLTFTLNGTELVAVDGMIVAEIVPAGPRGALLKVTNSTDAEIETMANVEDPVGSESNPIKVNDPSELGGIDVAGKGETYIAVSSQLNGQILTIVGDANTTVNVNGTDLTAVNGVFTVELTGVPTNKIVVGNKGDNDASYVASISYPAGSESNPVVINPVAGAVENEAAAGSTTYYVINGSYNGNYVVVAGEGLTVTVNGTEVKASNGKYVVELTGTPVNSIVIANSGTAAATYSIVTSDNPPTGDAGILMPVVAALVSVMGAAVLVIKKKEN